MRDQDDTDPGESGAKQIRLANVALVAAIFFFPSSFHFVPGIIRRGESSPAALYIYQHEPVCTRLYLQVYRASR